MSLAHFSLPPIPAAKLEGLVTFLTTSLAHLGFKEHLRPLPNVVGLGERTPFLWLNSIPLGDDSDAKTLADVLSRQHVAFTAHNEEEVREFYKKALDAGGIDNGKPGLRPDYLPGYYAAFVRDPECGVNWEVVCFLGAGVE